MSRQESATKILVVDDELQIQKLLGYGLGGSGWKVVSARTGEEALGLVASESPACVLLDVGLPQMNGVQTLKKLRSFSSVPVIMLTVEDDESVVVEALEAGADDYVTKPFAMPVLKARILAVLRRFAQPNVGETAIQPVYIAKHLRINFDSHKVFVSEREVHLTATEFELLEMFVRSQGRVLTHQVILAKIWGTKAGDQMHYLRVYVNSLRRKIEVNPSIPKLIVTEPGVGYRFEA